MELNLKEESKIDLRQIIIGVIVGVIVTIIVGYFVIDSKIEKIVSGKLKDHEVIKQVARLVRPSFTFNHEGIIQSDSGAKQFINLPIKVELEKGEPGKIIISPKQHLNAAPTIDCRNDNFVIKPTRKGAKGSEWVYDVYRPYTSLWSEKRLIKEWSFRLEIIW